MNQKYNPKDFEDKSYKEWEEKDYFKPSMNSTKIKVVQKLKNENRRELVVC